jgi:hypothetical protein
LEVHSPECKCFAGSRGGCVIVVLKTEMLTAERRRQFMHLYSGCWIVYNERLA